MAMYCHTVLCTCLTERDSHGFPAIMFDTVYETDRESLGFRDMAEILYSQVEPVSLDSAKDSMYFSIKKIIFKTHSDIRDPAKWDFRITKTKVIEEVR